MSKLSEIIQVEEAIRKAEAELDPFGPIIDPKRSAIESSVRRLRERLAELQESYNGSSAAMAAQPITWKGKAIEFADWIRQAFRDGKLQADSELNAYTQASGHFLDKNGSPFKPRALQQALRNRTRETTP